MATGKDYLFGIFKSAGKEAESVLSTVTRWTAGLLGPKRKRKKPKLRSASDSRKTPKAKAPKRRRRDNAGRFIARGEYTPTR